MFLKLIAKKWNDRQQNNSWAKLNNWYTSSTNTKEGRIEKKKSYDHEEKWDEKKIEK